ncbi:hypothetical protein ACO1O0_007503 [Amphichorda felina]
MAQPTVIGPNGTHALDSTGASQPVAPGKRKRDSTDDGEGIDVEDEKPSALIDASPPPTRDQRELVKYCFEALSSIDIEPPILKRPLPDPVSEDEPETKRQKSAEPPSSRSISDKVAASAYDRLSDLTADLASAIKASLVDIEEASSENGDKPSKPDAATRIRNFKKNAMDLLRREEAYPQTPSVDQPGEQDQVDAFANAEVALSLFGHAPQERRLFSSLPLSHNVDLSEVNLPAGVSMTRVLASNPQERTPTLGELFAPPRVLPPLQPPKQPKTQAKGNTLDFYHPELIDKSQYRTNSYFSTKLSVGHFLDYSHATPSSSAKARHHERAQSLAGKKPSTSELELSELDALFRGAFSSFAPCKDDSAAVVPSNIAGRIWWQRAGRQNFQSMIEIEYYEQDGAEKGAIESPKEVEVDEQAIQEAIDHWDDSVVDPTLEDAMGIKRDADEKEADEILDEVSDMIETLASYQRIRNLNLPNSQNRQTSDPVTGDMLANSGPQPSEEEQATYQMLKAQLALIIKTLPPYAIAKLNGDQLEDLLISTKVQIATDQYKGVMEEDDAAAQARMRAQQQAAQASARPPQRTPSMSYANQYHTPNNQYATPTRPPSQSQQFFRPGVTPNYQPNFQQQQRQFPASAHQPRPPQPNQYSRPNGYPGQYATQLAKAQTPFGHQNMPQYTNQQRPQFSQMPQQGTPNSRYPYQQPGTPTQGHYSPYTNGSGMHQQQHHQQRMSPQVPQRQVYSPSPNMQQNQRYGTPTQAMGSQGNRFSGTPNPGGQHHSNSSLGYHTVIPEAQQQRILEQAKARVAAQERSAMFTDKISQPGVTGLGGIGLGGSVDVNRLAAARAQMGGQQKPGTPTGGQRPVNGTPGSGHVPPHKVTPVPLPVIPGQQQQPQPQQQQRPS